MALMDAAWEAGITTFDTADAYGGGTSESWIGEWIRGRGAAVRDSVVIATKTYNPMSEGADSGLSPGRIRRQVDSSLARLGVEHVGLFLAHEFDTEVPLAATMTAFDQLVQSGKVGAVGASNFSAEQLEASLDVSAREGLTRYEWVQNSFSLLDRGDDLVLAACARHGLGYTPFGPLAGGWLSGKYRRDAALPAGSRMTLRPEPYAAYRSPKVFDALEALEHLAADLGVSMAGLALRWNLGQPAISAIVIGPNRVEHLTPALEAVAMNVSDDVLRHIGKLFE